MSDKPPRPPFALGIGVIGHRPHPERFPELARSRVTEEVQRTLGLLHAEARTAKARHGDLFAGDEPVLTLVSALAEGADRIVAKAALAQGFALDAPFPFPRAVYEQDFTTPDSRTEFHALDGATRAVLELPGCSPEAGPADRDVAYEAAGLTVLAQSDILITIWDGEKRGGRGGTADLLPIAARAGLPIIHIDARGEKTTRLLWSGHEGATPAGERLEDVPARPLEDALADLIDRLTAPPRQRHEREGLEAFLGASKPGLSWFAFPALMALAWVRRFRWSDIVLIPPATLAERFAASQATATGGAAKPDALFARSYGWADALAVSFSQNFRSAFVMNFILAALAVVASVVPLLFDDPAHLDHMASEKLVFVLGELIFIAILIGNTWHGTGRKWHGRWLEARELAERLRTALPLWVVGLRPAAFVSAEPVWTGWYSRAVLRAAGLRAGTLDQAGLDKARRSLVDLLEEQRRYNETTWERMHHLNQRLEWFGLTLFWATAGMVAVFLVADTIDVWMKWPPIPPRMAFLLTAFAAGLPALATASYGIRVIGDFEGIARRAKRTEGLLRAILDKVEQEKTPTLPQLRARARATAEALLGDVSNWRLAAESRELNVPG